MPFRQVFRRLFTAALWSVGNGSRSRIAQRQEASARPPTLMQRYALGEGVELGSQLKHLRPIDGERRCFVNCISLACLGRNTQTKYRNRDRSSDGPELPQLKAAGSSQVRHVRREREEGLNTVCDARVTDTRRVGVSRKFLTRQQKLMITDLLPSP